MKRIVLLITAAFMVMALLPLLSAHGEPSADRIIEESSSSAASAAVSEPSDPSPDAQSDEENCFTVWDTGSQQTVRLKDDEFMVGALAYEMPPTYEKEALKAQCIACYTHFCRLRNQQKEHPDETLQGADFAADLSAGQYYLSPSLLQEKWGEKYEDYLSLMKQVVSECQFTVLSDENGQLPDVCYHAISPGRTENAEDIFGFPCPCQSGVPSPWDRTAPGFQTVVKVPEKELFDRLHEEDPETDKFSPDQLIGDSQTTSAGTVLTIRLGTKDYSGTTLREWFGLRSAAFTLSYADGMFIFTVSGYGHGVGMSQYGANAMAAEGIDAAGILSHYYPGISLKTSSITAH